MMNTDPAPAPRPGCTCRVPADEPHMTDCADHVPTPVEYRVIDDAWEYERAEGPTTTGTVPPEGPHVDVLAALQRRGYYTVEVVGDVIRVTALAHGDRDDLADLCRWHNRVVVGFRPGVYELVSA